MKTEDIERFDKLVERYKKVYEGDEYMVGKAEKDIFRELEELVTLLEDEA